MKRITFFKTLLLAAGLSVGANAWGQTATWTMDANGTYSQGMELSSNTSVVSVKLGNGTWNYDGTWGVCETNNSTKPTKTNDIPTSGNYIVIKPTVDVSVSLDTRSSTNHNFVLIEESAPTTEIINVRARYYVTYTLGTAASPLKAGKTYYVYSTGGASLGYRAFTAKSVENWTIHYVDDSDTPVTIKDDVVYSGLYGDQVTAGEEDMASIEYGGKTYGYKSGNETITLGTGTNEITLVYETASVCNYTIKYVDGDNNSIADDVVVESIVGAEVTASGGNLPTYIWKNDVKYKYASGNTVLTLTGEANNDVITLVYAEAAKYNYAVKTSYGDVIYNQEGSAYENETITYYWAAVMNNGGVLYTAAAANNAYKGSFVLDSDNKVQTVSYTPSTTVTSLVFLNEGENLFVKGTGSSADTRGSMGAGGYQNSPKGFVTLDPGKYILVISNRCSGNRTGIHVFTAGTGDDAVTVFAADGIGNNATRTSKEFTLMKSTTIYFNGGSDNQWVDWLYIYKTGDATVQATLGENGYTTFASPYSLDLTKANLSGAIAYKAAVNGNVVQFTELNQTVPANTGVLLGGTAGATVTIPVVAAGTEVTDNAFLVNAAGTTFDAEGGYTYFGMIKDSDPLTFGKFAPGTVAIPANKAYLKVANTSTARLSVSFDDDNTTTGISSVNVNLNDDKVYNLNGQRVNNPKKGLFIVNGKKFINK